MHQPVISTVVIYWMILVMESNTQPIFNGCWGDMVFVMDASSSIWIVDYRRQLDFVANLVDTFDIGPGPKQVGISAITFSDRAYLDFPLDRYQNLTELKGAILKIPYRMGGTNTGAALKLLRRVVKPYVRLKRRPLIAVVITDGLSYDSAHTRREAKEVHRLGINIHAIGVGDHYAMRELKAIASDPIHGVHEVTSYSALKDIADIFRMRLCEVTTPTPTTPTTETPTTETPTTEIPTPIGSTITMTTTDKQMVEQSSISKTPEILNRISTTTETTTLTTIVKESTRNKHRTTVSSIPYTYELKKNGSVRPETIAADPSKTISSKMTMAPAKKGMAENTPIPTAPGIVNGIFTTTDASTLRTDKERLENKPRKNMTSIPSKSELGEDKSVRPGNIAVDPSKTLSFEMTMAPAIKGMAENPPISNTAGTGENDPVRPGHIATDPSKTINPKMTMVPAIKGMPENTPMPNTSGIVNGIFTTITASTLKTDKEGFANKRRMDITPIPSKSKLGEDKSIRPGNMASMLPDDPSKKISPKLKMVPAKKGMAESSQIPNTPGILNGIFTTTAAITLRTDKEGLKNKPRMNMTSIPSKSEVGEDKSVRPGNIAVDPSKTISSKMTMEPAIKGMAENPPLSNIPGTGENDPGRPGHIATDPSNTISPKMTMAPAMNGMTENNPISNAPGIMNGIFTTTEPSKLRSDEELLPNEPGMNMTSIPSKSELGEDKSVRPGNIAADPSKTISSKMTMEPTIKGMAESPPISNTAGTGENDPVRPGHIAVDPSKTISSKMTMTPTIKGMAKNPPIPNTPGIVNGIFTTTESSTLRTYKEGLANKPRMNMTSIPSKSEVGENDSVRPVNIAVDPSKTMSSKMTMEPAIKGMAENIPISNAPGILDRTFTTTESSTLRIYKEGLENKTRMNMTSIPSKSELEENDSVRPGNIAVDPSKTISSKMTMAPAIKGMPENTQISNTPGILNGILATTEPSALKKSKEPLANEPRINMTSNTFNYEHGEDKSVRPGNIAADPSKTIGSNMTMAPAIKGMAENTPIPNTPGIVNGIFTTTDASTLRTDKEGFANKRLKNMTPIPSKSKLGEDKSVRPGNIAVDPSKTISSKMTMAPAIKGIAEHTPITNTPGILNRILATTEPSALRQSKEPLANTPGMNMIPIPSNYEDEEERSVRPGNIAVDPSKTLSSKMTMAPAIKGMTENTAIPNTPRIANGIFTESTTLRTDKERLDNKPRMNMTLIPSKSTLGEDRSVHSGNIEVGSVTESPQKDYASTIVFGFDLISMGSSQSNSILYFINYILPYIGHGKFALISNAVCTHNFNIPLTQAINEDITKEMKISLLRRLNQRKPPVLVDILRQMNQELFKAAYFQNGEKPQRQIGVLFIDPSVSEITPEVLLEADQMKKNGFELFVISIGRVVWTDLKMFTALSSQPHSDFLFSVPTHTNLLQMIRHLPLRLQRDEQ